MLLSELNGADEIDWSRALIDASFAKAPEGGEDTGPNPTDEWHFVLGNSFGHRAFHLGAGLRQPAVVGVLMVLHTWGQNLHHHPHVHCVVSGGGLSCDQHGIMDASPTWRCVPARLLLAGARAEPGVSRQVPGRTACRRRRGQLPGRTWPQRRAPGGRRCTRKDWVVYAKPPFGGPAQVLKYLARYTHRVAISNARLLKLDDGQVTFRYKDYADAHRHKTHDARREEFLRRFVQHVLPKGFVKIRHYGLLANAQREVRLTLCRRLLLVAAVAAP